MGEMIRLDLIGTDGGTQPRAALSEELVEEYAKAMRAGAEFPPVVVFHDGSDHWLADGFHRVHARRKTAHGDIAADVRQGTRRDAILHSVGANAAHGMRRTNEDKRRAVLTLLNDTEWSAWSDREIGRQCGVSQPFVSSLRPKQPSPVSDNGYQMPRSVSRGGSIHTMKTGGIGGGPSASSTPTVHALSPLPEIVAEAEGSEPDDTVFIHARIKDACRLVDHYRDSTGAEVADLVAAEERENVLWDATSLSNWLEGFTRRLRQLP